METDQLFESAYALHEAGDLSRAEKMYRQILAERPNDADVLELLGVLSLQLGNRKQAREMLELSRKIDPSAPDCHYHLGVLQADAGEHALACESFAAAVRLKPDFAQALSQWGISLLAAGKYKEAAEAHRRATLLRVDSLDEYHLLANALFKAGDLEEAAAIYQRLLDLNPHSYPAAYALGFVLRQLGRLDDAIAAYKKALDLRWGDVPASNNLASAMKDTGQLDEALACYDQAIASEPENAAVASNRLYILHFHPSYDAESIFEEHRRWNDQHAVPLKRLIQPHANSRQPERPLRIGFVSPDFREHSVGRFFFPLLAEHDSEQFKAICYSDVDGPDQVTALLRSHADEWKDTHGFSDERMESLIREDQIDILVDLTMHMANNRMLLFARKPAPVQVTYLAYCSTTGLDTMDYRLTDPYLDPPGTNDAVYSEKSIRLPETYWCYPPHEEIPGAGVPRDRSTAPVTFGCLNNFCKVSQEVLDLWVQLMHLTPDSRLILHAHEGHHRERIRELVADYRMDPQRLQFVGKLPLPEYFRLYEQIDIGLDPFPCNGGTTTCDAIWMGVPVVTLDGRTAVGRSGTSILSNLGLPELIAQTPHQYVEIAAVLAQDRPRLSELRRTLRERMRRSPLMDASRFARNVEAAYRQMWRNWCESPAGQG